MRVRFKPVECDAVQFDGTNAAEVATVFGVDPARLSVDARDVVLTIVTDEYGPVTAAFGDWILRHDAGDLYPLSNAAFDVRYEVVP